VRGLHLRRIPKFGLILVQTWVFLLPSPAAAQAPGGFEPRLLRVEGIPEEAHEFWRLIQELTVGPPRVPTGS